MSPTQRPSSKPRPKSVKRAKAAARLVSTSKVQKLSRAEADEPACAVMILAAGMGKRMRSTLPKVLHEAGGQPLLFHILDQVQRVAPSAPVAIVVGHGRELVESAVAGNPSYATMSISFVHQAEQKGTGHAARCAMDSAWGDMVVGANLITLVLPGDLPLIPETMVAQMVAPIHKADLRLLTCDLPDPTGYGRVVRKGASGPVLRITEQKDANAKELAIHEVAASIYSFQPAFLKSGLHRLSNKNAQREYYLTDLIAQAAQGKRGVEVLKWAEAEDLRGVNDPWELALAKKLVNQRILRRWAKEGVRITDLDSTWVDAKVELAEDVALHPGAILSGSTRVAKGAIIGPSVVLKNVEVGEGAYIKTGSVAEDSVVGAGAQLGPYAHLRPESVVGPKAKIGNFVELKKATIGANTAISHLSYVGDAEVGERVNIGCGFVTCNFDGRVINGQRKHKTVIEDDVFLGSDCQTVAPIRIGKGAYIASGSTITQDVEADALAIARSRQVTKPGYAKRLRPSKE